ncbi:PaaX family transcriptional regulator C-terminal domain-containing protein [uncultured Pseudoteredinibacter sp.]|uniref:PaaX family transcriptional regulator C-terminal domain-containing protein n=1 Tax=uncultured Pseudoteredinibacter sp. TaxID=1641701 RepID=UPI00262D3D24|nr:PaaX family transcriptional regulator C-terminal domain-containing protein [uncultured Pseudoteredinibacter sp.]
MALKPKHLILNLLLEAERAISSQVFIRICQLFDITENSARVTLARLSSEGMVEAPERGLYQLGPRSRNLAADLASWRELESKLCDWDGSWIGVYQAMLGRSDRTALRRRERLLQLAGFSALEQGLAVRPNNLVGGVQALRKRLQSIGLEEEAIIFRIDELDGDSHKRAMSLWDRKDLEQHYRDAQKIMADWMARAEQLDPETAAKESFLIGDEYIRCIAYDPMLPEEMVDTQLRREYLQTLIAFDQMGKSIWQQLYQEFAQVG